MPDPKPKKSLNDLVTQAGNEVLGQQEKLPSNNSMSDDELLTIFGGNEKKKPSPSVSSGLPPTPPQEEQKAELGQSYAPEKKPSTESGNGSSNQSSKPKDNGIGIASSAISKLNQRLLDLPAQLLETSAILGAEMEKIAPTGEGPTDPQQSYMYKGAQKYRDWIKELYPTNPEHEKNDPYYTNTIAGSTGDLLALLGTGATARGSQALNQLTQASVKSGVLPLIQKAAQTAGNYVSNPSVLTGAIQMGTGEWEQAKQAGATDDQAFEVFIKNASVGSLMESIPVMHFFKRLDNVTGGGVKNAIKKGAVQGLEEMTTEVAQQFYSNYTASQTYDATRKWFDGMKESGGIGFGMGFVLGAMGASLRKRQETAQTLEEKAEIQKSIDFVNEKSSEMKNGTLNDQGENVVPETTEPPVITPEGTLPTESPEAVAETTTEVAPTSDVPTQEIDQTTPLMDTTQELPSEVIENTEAAPVDQSVSTPELTASEETINTTIPEETVIQSETPTEQPDTINVEETTISTPPETEPPVTNEEDTFIQEISSSPETIKTALEDGKIQEAVKNGIVSPERAAEVIQSAGLEVPQDLSGSVNPVEQEMVSHVQEDKPIDDFKEEFDSTEDFEVVKEYINDTKDGVQETTDTIVSPEGQTLEETKTEITEGSGIIGTLRDKRERLANIDGEEKIKLAEEIVQDVDNYLKTNPAVLSETNAPKKDRRFAQQVLKNPDLSDEIKKGLSEEGKTYIPITNKLTIKEADALIEEKGIEQATKDFENKNNGLHPAVRTTMGELLIKKYNKLANESTNTEERNKNIDQAIKVADDLSVHLTSLGQAIQAASVFTRLSPEGVLRAIDKEFKKTRKKKLAQLSPEINATETEMNKINSESIEEALSGKFKSVIQDKKDKSAATKRKKAVKDAVDFLESIKIKTKGNTLQEASIFAIPVAAYNSAITTIQVSLKAGDLVATAIEKGVKYIKDHHKGEWDEAGFRKDISEKLSSHDQIIDPKKILENEIKDSGIKIEEIIKKHFTEVDETKQSLTEKLVKDSGLTEQDAKDLANEIQKEFDHISTKKKREYLNKKISGIEKSLQPKKATKKKQLYEKIIELTNAKALTHKEFEDLYAQYFELPKITPEQSRKITDLADKVQTAKGPEAKNKATQDLLKYQESLKGIDYGDVAMSIWYANILSGLSTQTMNVYANFAETAGEAFTSIVDDPKKSKQMLHGLFQGYGKGILQAKDVLKTGYSPVKDNKIDVQNILERYDLPGGRWNPYNYLKYVGRVMSAADIFAYSGLKEMRSQQLAMAMALKEGKEKPTPDIEKRANEILYNTKDRIAEATQKATEEGLTGEAKQRRIFELMEEGRPEELNEDAKDFASEGTFNFDPVGTMGALTQGINHASNIVNIKGVKPLSFIVPFTRIIANVTNRYLDWSPWGLVRAAKGGIGYNNPIYGEKFVKKYTPEERRREWIKATTGTIAMTALYAMTEPDDEGNSEIEITADGTGNFKKNYELQETGWRPYSIKIGDRWYEYKNTPLAIPFAWVGHIRDAQKYKGEKSLAEKLSIMVYGSAKYLMDMSFLSALSDFFTAFSKDQAEGASFLEKSSKATARTAKSFVVPNLYTQLSRSYQEINDMPMKQAKSVMDEMVRDTPILRDHLNNMYNSLGEPVYPDQNRKYIPFKASQEDSDKVWNLITDNQAWIGLPSKNMLIYDPSIKGERSMTEDEYNRFCILAGQKTKKKILDQYDALIKMDKKYEVQERVKKIKETARKSAKYEVLKK